MHSIAAIILCLLAVVTSAVMADSTSAPATRPVVVVRVAPSVVDAATDCIDPYNPSIERERFFRAAGSDNELSAAEFAAAAGQPNSFVRSFDRWENIRQFDRDANGQIDWFEADAYRQALRQAVLASFDHDKDNRLTGTEREQALQALAEGKVAITPPRQQQRVVRVAGGAETPDGPETQAGPQPPGRMQGRRPQNLPADQPGRQMDRAGRRGEGTPQTAPDAQRPQFQRPEGAPQLNDEERAARREEMRQRAEQFRGRQAEQPAEGSDPQQARQRAERIGRDIEVRMLDRDGDGVVSDEERQAAQRQFQEQMDNWRRRAERQMDTDGDGVVSDEERRAFEEQVRQRVQRRVQEFTARFDADGDGQLNDQERENMMRGLREEMETRRARYDRDGDGRLNAEEYREMMEDLRSEFME